MKKLITLLFLVSAVGFAALPSSSVWEVRPTVGADTNGGGFVTGASGTDMSQFNNKNAASCTSCQSATVNISTTDAVCAGTTTLVSATANFSSAIVGDIILLSGGSGSLTAVWKEVTVFTNSTTVTIDSSCAASTGTTMNIGGALATATQANTNSTANNNIWVKATGTYTVTSALIITLDSHAAPGNPYSISGYTSTRGDNGKVTWTTATNSIDLIDMSSGSSAAVNVLIANFNFTTTAGIKGDALKSLSASVNSVNVTVMNCIITGFSVGIEGNASVTSAFEGLSIINSRVTGSTSHGVRNGVANTYVFGSMLDNNGGDGFNTGTTFSIGATPMTYMFVNTIAYKNGANGINVAYVDASNIRMVYILVSNCDLSTNTMAGLLTGSSTNPLVQASNTIFDANGTYGFDTSSTSITMQALVYSNAFFSNTTAPTRGVNAGQGTITLTANPYTTIGTNFALNNTTGGGKLLKGAGFPGTIPNGGTGAVDVGALQTAGSAGGGQVGFGIIQ